MPFKITNLFFYLRYNRKFENFFLLSSCFKIKFLSNVFLLFVVLYVYYNKWPTRYMSSVFIKCINFNTFYIHFFLNWMTCATQILQRCYTTFFFNWFIFRTIFINKSFNFDPSSGQAPDIPYCVLKASDIVGLIMANFQRNFSLFENLS